jgi:hypothetical protein
MDRRGSRRLILVAALAGLLLRLAFGLTYWTDKPLTHDEREYLALAKSLREGRGFSYAAAESPGPAPRFGRAPGYPAFLSILPIVPEPEHSPAIVKILQAALGAASILLIAALAARAAGPGAGVLAAWMGALYPSLIWMPAYVLSEAVYMPIALAVALLLDRALDADGKERAGPVALAGAIGGLSALIRPGALVFLGLVAAWLVLRRRWTLAAAFAIGAALLIAPWTIRNAQRYGRIVLIASEGGVTFWTGNHPSARGEGDLAANPEVKQAEVAFRAQHAGLSAEQLEPLYYADALRQIRERPVWWLGLVARKAFYTIVPIGPSYTLHSTKYLVASLVPYAMVAPLAIAGFLIIRRHGRPPTTLYLMAASVVLTSLIFFPQERFRLPVIDPLLILGAAAALSSTGRQTT